jgi:ATP-dependent helicase/nuclease subunit B
MSVTFVIGRAGSGKTRRCFDRIVAAMRAEPIGRPIYWIVPRQATFTAERELTCSSGLGAFTRAQVLSFEKLADAVLAACGGSAVPEVSALGRQMILGHLLRRLQPRLHFFKSVARQPGVARELDDAFAELERAGKGSADLALLLDEREPFADTEADPDALVPKLRDLKLLYDEYTAFLGQDRLDQHRRTLRVRDCLKRMAAFRGAAVHVDGFYDFTEHERQLIAGLAQAAASVEVTLTIDPASPTLRDPHHVPDDLSLFHRSEEAYRRLWFTLQDAGVRIGDPVVLRDAPTRYANGAARLLERHLFDGRTAVAKETQGVELLAAPDRATEVHAAARRIRELVTSGRRLRDVAVLVRDVERYEPLIASAFREHELPYFVDRRRTAAYHPLLMFARAAIRIARFDWPHDAVMSLLKSGLAGVTADDADELENYVLAHRLRGGAAWESPQPWAYRGDLTNRANADDADADVANAAPDDPAARAEELRRQLVARLQPLVHACKGDAACSLRSLAAGLFQVIDACGVRQTLLEWMTQASAAGDVEQHDEHQQVWAEFVALCDQMVELLGDAEMTSADFSDVLESGLERFDLALTPPTVDQVLVGQVDRTRTPGGLKVAVIMGLVEGEFPRPAGDSCILTDAERKALRRRKLDLDPDPRRRLLDERFLGYVALTRASELLVLTRPLTHDGGEPAAPSPFWREVERMFPTVATTEVSPTHVNEMGRVSTPRQLVLALARWVRAGGATAVDDATPPSGTPVASGFSNGGAADCETAQRLATADAEAARTCSALYHWLATRPTDGSSLDVVRRHAWSALSYSNDAALSADVARVAFPAPLNATASRLETFAACPFRHFARYGLRLLARPSQAVTAVDLSQAYHHAMERLVAEALAAGSDWAGDAPPVGDDAIKACTHRIGEALRNELMISSARNRYLLRRVERAIAQVIESQCEAMRRGTFRPQRSGLKYGDGGIAPLRVMTPGGAEVLVRGSIDRVDHAGQHVAVVDYRLGSNQLSLQEVYHGLSLQLLTGLLALQDGGRTPGGRPALPAAAFYLQMVRHLQDVDHPDEAADPASVAFKLRVKPRGVIEAGAVPALDAGLAEGTSEVVNVHVKKGGGFGNRRRSDVAEPAEFAALLAHVRSRIARIADRILGGDVAIAPYKLGTESPCPRCEFHGVCRFEPSVNRYRHLSTLGREQALQRMTEGGDADA